MTQPSCSFKSWEHWDSWDTLCNLTQLCTCWRPRFVVVLCQLQVLFNLLTSSCRNQSPDDPALMFLHELRTLRFWDTLCNLTQLCTWWRPRFVVALCQLQVLFNLLTSSCRSQSTDDPAQRRKEQGRNSTWLWNWNLSMMVDRFCTSVSCNPRLASAVPPR